MGRRRKNKEADAIGEPAECERLTGDNNSTNNTTANEATNNKKKTAASIISNAAPSTSVADHAITTATGTISVSTTIVNNATSSFDASSSAAHRVAVAKRQSILLKRGDTDLSLDRTGLQRFLPSCMQYAFADHEAEALYREYYENEKRSDFKVLVTVLLIVSLVLLILFAATFNINSLVQLLTLVTCVLALLVIGFLSVRRQRPPQRIWTLLPFVMWTVQVGHVLCDLWLYDERPRLPPDSVAWLLLYTYSIYVLFPLRLRFCCLLSMLLAVGHLLLVGLAPRKPHDINFSEQVSAFVRHTSLSEINSMISS